MKKLYPYIIAITLLFTIVGGFPKIKPEIKKAEYSTQELLEFRKDTLHFTFSKELTEPLIDYLDNAYASGIDMTNLNQLEAIYYTNSISYYTGGDDYGLTLLYEPGKDFIFISDSIELYLPTFIEAILYHEFFHLILQTADHCDGPICPYIVQDGYKIDVETVIRNWGKEEKEYYFKFIKDYQNR